MSETHVPVLIVGAGLAGGSAAMFLGLHGVKSLVVERHPSTSNQPKARGQTWHTMEALGYAGVADKMTAAGYDVSLGMPIVIAQTVTGPPIHEILGEEWPQPAHVSPATIAMASQERAEPILMERAVELGAQFRFRTKLESFRQDADGVTAELRDLATSEVSTVTADYLVAADGWRGEIRDGLGIGTHGRGEIGNAIGVVFDADLDHVVKGREFALFYLQNPELSDTYGTGAFVGTDTPGRWVVMFAYDPAVKDFADYTDDEVIEKVRIAVGIPDLDVRLVSRAATGLAHRVADRFSSGRVFLTGDAAHTMPPHGGQGGNTAVMDGFYLAWKLAYVLRGYAGPGLLDSYDVERRPYGELIAGQQYANMIFRSAPQLADGTEDQIVDPLAALFGYRYPDGAVVAEEDEDGARLEDPATPTGRPGSRAPHVWLGEGRSTIHLFGREFVLLTSSQAWADAAAEVSLDVPLRTVVLDSVEWQEKYGVGPAGASLVRPDRFVAWRSVGAGTAADLEGALKKVLSR
jgi:2-polyprenyl-6-methoxyphenol hydroxylase-like FAD-dependent oxidoreductase